nr:unnamed protein product [Digitaria exilis]
MSGDTEIIPSSGQGSETAPLDNNAETEIVNPASDGDDSNESSSQRNRTKVLTSQANVVHVDKVIINKKLKDRLSRVMESVPRVIPDNEPAEVECQAATGEALGPSVFIQAKTNATALQDAAGPSKVWDYSGPPFNLGFDSESQEKDEMANSQPQEAHVHVQAQPEEVQQDQDVHVPPHSQLARNEERTYENVGQPTTMPRPEPSSANRVTEQINVNTGCFNNVVPLVAVDSNGVVLYDNTPPTPEGNVEGETFHVQPSSFDQLHRTNDEEDEILICLGSTSKNQHPERKRQIIQPSSYFRDFAMTINCPKLHVYPEERRNYECLEFYQSLPEYSRFQAANVNDARIKYVREMVFTPHNRLNSAKDLLDNHIAMQVRRKNRVMISRSSVK